MGKNILGTALFGQQVSCGCYHMRTVNRWRLTCKKYRKYLWVFPNVVP